MRIRWEDAARATSAAAFLATGALGLGAALTRVPLDVPTSEAARTAAFLDRARRAVPAGESVLVLTSLLPPPDVGFWFGVGRSMDVLMEIDPAAFDAEPLARELGSIEEARASLANARLRLDGPSLAEKLPKARFVVITNDLRGALPPSPVLRDAEVLIEDGPRRVLRVAR